MVPRSKIMWAILMHRTIAPSHEMKLIAFDTHAAIRAMRLAMTAFHERVQHGVAFYDDPLGFWST